MDKTGQIASLLNNMQIDGEIPENLLTEAKKNKLVIVYVKDEYNVRAFSTKTGLLTYKNNNAIYFNQDQIFVNATCFEYSDCRWFNLQYPKAFEVEFHLKENVWECETTIPHAEFDLICGKQLQSRGIVFLEKELEAEFTDTQLLDALEELNRQKNYSGKCYVRKPRKGLGFRLGETKKDGAAGTVRQAIINYIRQ